MSEPIDFQKEKKRRRKAKAPDDDGPLHEMDERFALVKVGAENRVVEFTTGADGKPTVAFRTTRAFREEYGNRFIARGDTHKPIGDVWLKWSGRRTFQGITFAPQGAPEGWLIIGARCSWSAPRPLRDTVGSSARTRNRINDGSGCPALTAARSRS